MDGTLLEPLLLGMLSVPLTIPPLLGGHRGLYGSRIEGYTSIYGNNRLNPLLGGHRGLEIDEAFSLPGFRFYLGTLCFDKVLWGEGGRGALESYL